MVCVGVARVKRRMYQRKVDVDMLNAVKSVRAKRGLWVRREFI